MMLKGWRERRARRTAEALRKGEIIRQLHWQCWRPDAPPLETPLADLVEVLPVLIESGSVGLVWPRLWHRAEELGAVGAALAAAYDAQVAHNARVERDIARVVTRLREHGVEPVLIKGLAVARLYPAPLVRTAGDIDLVVRDGDYATAKAALADLHLSFHGDPASRRAQATSASAAIRNADQESPIGDVDLHSVAKWYGAVDERFVTEAERVGIDMESTRTEVRVPRVEDHLRALCLHFLRHGAVRPLRLCDIALLAESAPALDRDRLLAGTAREAEYVAVTLRLAEALLGARLDAPPDEVRTHPLPAWLAPAALQQWGENPQRHTPHIRELLGGPRAAYHALASRWPDSISANMRLAQSPGHKPGNVDFTKAYLLHLWRFVRSWGGEQTKSLLRGKY